MKGLDAPNLEQVAYVCQYFIRRFPRMELENLKILFSPDLIKLILGNLISPAKNEFAVSLLNI